MAKSVLVRVSLVRAALLGATALALFGAPFTIDEAAAKVGVTSATDGDPLGKPPQEAERVLRIGIDVQANELITTNENDRAHLVFLDGSSLTVGPNAQLTIDRFVFDPSTKTGELAINASKGVLRLVGGKISKGQPITITTPSSTIGIRGGITILDVKARQTDSIFVFGKDMTVRGAGQTQVATRPGSMILTNLGSPPGMPTILAQGALNAQLSALEGRRAPASGGGGGSGRNADQAAQGSGLSAVNSGQSVRIVAPGVPDNFGSGPGPNSRNPNDTILTALSDANQSQQTTIAVQQQRQQQQQQQVETPPDPAASPAAADGNCHILRRDGRCREWPHDVHRQLPKRVELRPECRNRHRELPGSELPGSHSWRPWGDVLDSPGHPGEQPTSQAGAERCLLRAGQPAWLPGRLLQHHQHQPRQLQRLRRLRRRKALTAR